MLRLQRLPGFTAATATLVGLLLLLAPAEAQGQAGAPAPSRPAQPVRRPSRPSALAPQPAGATAAQVQWDAIHVTTAERAQVLTLARQLGIDKPFRVRETIETGPGRCPQVVVESAHIRELHEVSWAEVTLSRDAPREGCGFGELLAGAPRVGRFATWDHAEPQVRWLIEDGDWSIELPQDRAVRFEVAEQIALAFHRGTVVDQRGANSPEQAPSVAAMVDDVIAISAFPSPYTIRLKPGRIGSASWMASVYIDNGQVYLFNIARVTSVGTQR